MFSYCLKFRKNIKGKNPRVVKTKNENQYFYRIVQCMIVKYQDI